MINSLTAEKALSVSIDMGGMDCNAAVNLVMFAVFFQLLQKFKTPLLCSC